MDRVNGGSVLIKIWVLLEEGVAEFWHGLRKLDLVSSCLREEELKCNTTSLRAYETNWNTVYTVL